MHLVIVSREDPSLPLSRYRARGQLTELRAADLRFTPAEAAEFLNRVMSLNLAVEEIAALEARTEGWIAGLQLAALSMQGHQDAASFIKSFTGSHHFVLDYLVEEVLQQQSESIQTFLLRTRGDEPIFIELSPTRWASVNQAKPDENRSNLSGGKAHSSYKRGIIGMASSVDFQ
jgi:LuxR family maltose regulon positive regulatory protein